MNEIMGDTPVAVSPLHPLPTKKEEFWRGARESLAFALASIPVSLIAGLTAVKIGLTFIPAFLSHLSTHAVASQLASYQLLVEGTDITIIVLTVGMINLRLLIYSASLAPYWKDHPLWLRLIAAYFITDPSYISTIRRYTDQKDQSPYIIWYFFGLSLSIFAVWVTANIVGIVLGQSLPKSWSLDFAIIALFLGLLMLTIRNNSTFLAAVVGAGVAIIFYNMPYNLGVLFGTTLGVVAAYIFNKYVFNQPKAFQRN